MDTTDAQPTASASPATPRESWKGLLLLLAGIVLGQCILYGPSLVGAKILLPLDLLARPGNYLPRTPEWAKIEPSDTTLSDLVTIGEPSRRFAAGELRAGRWPVWNPAQYAGAPEPLPKSPFMVLRALFRSPRVIPWAEMLAAIVGGTGVYAFARRAMGIEYWPATVAGWCFPVAAFFVLWQGYAVGYPVVFLPWLMLAVDRAVRLASGGAGLVAAGLTWLILEEGRMDTAGQVLLASGLYAVWCFLGAHRGRWFSRGALCGLGCVAAGWAFGFLLAAPDLLPGIEYARTGLRMIKRGAGNEERPPVGISTLPPVVLPNMYGTTGQGSIPLFPDKVPNLLESTSSAYAGLPAALLLAPLAFLGSGGPGRRRGLPVFLVLLGFLGLAWSLNVPGIVNLMRMPGLNMLSMNRFTFVTAFAITMLAAAGLDAVWRDAVKWRAWHWLFALAPAALGAWCVHKAKALPEPLATQLAAAIGRGDAYGPIRTMEQVRAAQLWFVHAWLFAAGLCAVAVAGWLLVRNRWLGRRALAVLLGFAALADLLCFDYGRNPQCDPALYFPKIPALEFIANAGPGRVVGYACLPARFAEMAGLRDIRGYNAIDPERLMNLMGIAADPNFTPLPYALTQWYQPAGNLRYGTITLSPVMDMLGVRYVIFRGAPPPGVTPAFSSPDYWVVEVSTAMPRAFVPGSVAVVPDTMARLAKIAQQAFDPRQVAYVETPVDLPQECRGTAEITQDLPAKVTVAAHMQTPGLVILDDVWDAGWQAQLNGKPAPILVADHALRGVVAPAGDSTIEFRYEPRSGVLGSRLALAALAALAVWGFLIYRESRSRTQQPTVIASDTDSNPQSIT